MSWHVHKQALVTNKRLGRRECHEDAGGDIHLAGWLNLGPNNSNAYAHLAFALG